MGNTPYTISKHLYRFCDALGQPKSKPDCNKYDQQGDKKKGKEQGCLDGVLKEPELAVVFIPLAYPVQFFKHVSRNNPACDKKGSNFSAAVFEGHDSPYQFTVLCLLGDCE